MPETADQTLEQLDARFSVPTRAHASYGIRQLKWFLARSLLFRNVPKPELAVPVHTPKAVTGMSTGHEAVVLGPGGNAAQLIERKFPVEETQHRSDSVVAAYGYDV